jgi:antitoxin ParD1/3/4
MNIHLTRPLEDYVRQRVADGGYASASEVVREAIRMMQDDEQRKLQVLREMIHEGERSGPAESYSLEKLNADLDAEAEKEGDA